MQNTAGVVSTSFLKDLADPAWKDDDAIKRSSAFMDKYYSDGDRQDSNVLFGYAAAETVSRMLEQCGDDLSRETSRDRPRRSRIFRVQSHSRELRSVLVQTTFGRSSRSVLCSLMPACGSQ